MRKIVIALIGLLTAACQSQNAGSAVVQSPIEVPAATKTPFFVGRWAAKNQLCSTAAWKLTQTRLSTPGHVVCTYHRPQPSGVYHLDATCTAEGPPAQYHLRISYAESAKALLVEGGPFQPIGLVRCE
ncbi:MAG TPA: hypothetical protein VFJ18_08775 [Pararhizobium sp.]|nr:hypothetical protein [Pararhizobium sp.]